MTCLGIKLSAIAKFLACVLLIIQVSALQCASSVGDCCESDHGSSASSTQDEAGQPMAADCGCTCHVAPSFLPGREVEVKSVLPVPGSAALPRPGDDIVPTGPAREIDLPPQLA